MTAQHESIVLGAGVTGLATAMASGCPAFEANARAGGICASYYMRPGRAERLESAPASGDAYRFEYGGGHWIFGGDPAVLSLIDELTPTRRYRRSSAVYFPERDLFVPYPLQNHLSHLGVGIASRAVSEIAAASRRRAETMADWIAQSFGPTLMELFFGPFHELYTAGLWTRIAPQDGYKSPIDLASVIQGAFGEAPAAGYNVTFVYPEEGLDRLAERMVARAHVEFSRRAARIHTAAREVEFEDGSSVRYERLLSTLPLNQVSAMCGIEVDGEPDPYTSVLVVNIGGTKGPRCPAQHWIYVPRSRSGFHRVGFYSNVDSGFVPGDAGAAADRVSIYVEKAYPGGRKPSDAEIAAVCRSIEQELQDWGFLSAVEVSDPTWVDVAYTWSWPGSSWKRDCIRRLQDRQVHQVGRYARWTFQGIADSIRDGLVAGSALGRRAAPAIAGVSATQDVRR